MWQDYMYRFRSEGGGGLEGWGCAYNTTRKQPATHRKEDRNRQKAPVHKNAPHSF
jgi:hypothetical protein